MLTMKSTRTYLNHRSLAFIVLITGILGGLLIVFSILLLCKYCLNRKNLREAEQMKLLYDTLNQASLIDSNRLCNLDLRGIPPLEPRRSNSFKRDLSQLLNSQQITSDYHSGNKQQQQQQHDSHTHKTVPIDDEQLYLQVDPRCYVRQNSNVSLSTVRRCDVPKLEKGHSINVDTRPSVSSGSLSPYRQSSFDVALASQSQQQSLTPSPATSTPQEIYYTPRGSSLSVLGNPISTTPTGSQHLSPPTPSTSRKNSAAIIVEKKDLTATLDPFDQTSTIRSAVVQREHEHSRSLEHSATLTEPVSSANDKQSRSFDAVHLLRPGVNRTDVVNRRTKSYEYADDRRPSTVSIAPAPIVIKIPDMSELVQAAQLSQFHNRRDSIDMEEYQRNTGRKSTLVEQLNGNDRHDEDAATASQDLWRLRQSYEFEEEQRRLGRTSPDELSPDLLTSTSIDSAGAMPIHNRNTNNTTTAGDDDLSRYQYRRKSSSNLLLPPPEVRRQALRRTFEKRRSCINQSNARREQQQFNDDKFDINHENSNTSIADFSSLLNNFNSKSENSSFERSLETDFDMQSDTSSRGPNDQFTSIESSGNENTAPDATNRVINIRRQPPIPQQQQSPQLSPHQDDSGYKSLESQNSQNRTFSSDWMSTDGAESVIYMGDKRIQQRSVDIKDLEDNSAEKPINDTRRSPKLLHTGLHHSYQEASTYLMPTVSSNSNTMQQRSLSTNIPVVDHYKPSPMNLSVLNNPNPVNNKFVTNVSTFNRTASKKRREFGKDKQYASVNVDPLTPDEQQTTVSQMNEIKTKSSSSLQVRHPDLRRTKSDEAKNLLLQNRDGSTTSESASRPNQTKSDNCLLSSSKGVLASTPTPIRQHLSPDPTNAEHSRYILQRSPSSTTSPVTPSERIAAFRSQRSAVSFDVPTPSLNSLSPTNKNKTSPPAASILSPSLTKSRLKFSMVRDTAMASLGRSAPIYSMSIARDYSIDERTNRIVNEFLMHDPALDERKNTNNNGENSHRGTATKRHHHHRIRPRTFDETTSLNTLQKQSSTQQPLRLTGNKQRYHTSSQANIRKHSQHQYPSVHLPDSIEQEEDDSSDAATSLLTSNQQLPSSATTRRENSMATGSPSIIITGDDSGS